MGQTEVSVFRPPARIKVGGTRNEVVLARIEIGIGRFFRGLDGGETLRLSGSVEKSVDKLGRNGVFRIAGCK